MSDPIENKVRLVLNNGVGDIIPFNDDIFDDARKAFYSLSKGWQKMKALRHIFHICHATGQVDKYLEITEEARQMRELLPYKADVLFFGGSICEDDCRYQQALDYYLRCLEFDTDTGWLRYGREINTAFCYLMQGDPFKAKQHCEAAIIIDPEQWLAWKNIGMCFEALEDYRQAADCYARAVKISRGDIGPVIYLRELVKRHEENIPDLEKIRKELSENGVLI